MSTAFPYAEQTVIRETHISLKALCKKGYERRGSDDIKEGLSTTAVYDYPNTYFLIVRKVARPAAIAAAIYYTWNKARPSVSHVKVQG